MPGLLNNSSRIIHVPGAVLVPGMPMEVPDEAMINQVVMDMMQEPVPDSDKMTLEEMNVAEPSIQERDRSRGEHGEADDPRHAQQRPAAPPQANHPAAQGGPPQGQHPQQTGGQQRPPQQQR